jgi:hypothetical protein
MSSNALVTVTNPAFSQFILKPTRLDNIFSISVPTVVGKSYIIEYCTNLNVANWLALTNITATSLQSFAYDIVSNDRQRFFRAKITTNSGLPIVLAARIFGGKLALSFNSDVGKYYSVQSGSGNGLWLPLTNFTAQSISPVVNDVILPSSRRFYRVSVATP